MEPDGSLPHSQEPDTCPYPEPDGFSLCPASNLSKIHFNIILSSMPRSSKCSPSLRFPHQNPESTSPLPHTCCLLCPSQPSWFDNPNNIWWGIQSITLPVMYSFPFSCQLVRLRFKCPPQHHILENPQPTFLPQCDRPSFTPTQNSQKDYSSVYLNLSSYVFWKRIEPQTSRKCSRNIKHSPVALEFWSSSVCELWTRSELL